MIGVFKAVASVSAADKSTMLSQGIGEAMVKSAVRTIGSQVGREIVRGVLGSILGGRRR
jgi:hypothetical protein